MSQPFTLENPDPPATFKTSDFAGEVVLVVIGGYHEGIATQQYGTKPAERVSIVMLTGRTAGKIYEDVVLFGQKQASQFQEKRPGSLQLCRIVKNGQSVTFDPGSDYDRDLAQRWIATNGQRLAMLQNDTVRNFHEQARQLGTQGSYASSGPTPEPSPQWDPAQAASQAAPAATQSAGTQPLPGDQPLPLEMPAPTPDATRQSLQSPGVPATASETGY
jgi:hypothetical protein